MLFPTWNPTYQPENPTGITSGTLEVPNFNPGDWHLISETNDEVKYRAVLDSYGSTIYNGLGVELTLRWGSAKNLYNSTSSGQKMSGSMKIPGLTGRTVYGRLVDMGVASGDDSSTFSDEFACPGVDLVFKLTVADGVNVKLTDIGSRLQVLLSAFSKADSAGDVAVGARIPELLQGALRIAG